MADAAAEKEAPSPTAADAAQPAKVVVLFKATGDAPILKQNKFKISANERFGKVVDFLRKQIQRDSVFVYLKSAFTPDLDDEVASLFEARSRAAAATFSEDGKLVLHYATTPAWG